MSYLLEKELFCALLHPDYMREREYGRGGGALGFFSYHDPFEKMGLLLKNFEIQKCVSLVFFIVTVIGTI